MKEPVARPEGGEKGVGAKVWRDLVGKQWRTNAAGTTDAMGQFTTRGHRGLYEVSVEAGGRKTTMPFHTERGTGMLRVVQ